MSYFACNMIKALFTRNLSLRHVSIYLYNLVLLQEYQTVKAFFNLVNKRHRQNQNLGKFQITFLQDDNRGNKGVFSSRTTARTLCSIPVKLQRNGNGKAHSPNQLSGTALEY